jgi:hypothetical protein
MRNLRQFIRANVSYCTSQFSSVQIFEEICVRSVQQILVLILFLTRKVESNAVPRCMHGEVFMCKKHTK